MRLDYKIRPVLVKRIIYITHKGKRRDSEMPPHRHASDAHELIFVDYGKMTLAIEGLTTTINPGECIFIPGAANHSFTGESGSPFNFMNIMFFGKVPPTLFGKRLTINRNCLALLEKLKTESTREQSYGREIMGCNLTELILCLLRQLEGSVPHSPPESTHVPRHQSECVNRALAVIAAEYASSLTLEQLSRAAGVGESRLRQLLKIETGSHFTTLLHTQRIAAAKHLISEGTFSLENIANAVGYQSSSFFFKVFKRITGMTPKAYLMSLGEPAE